MNSKPKIIALTSAREHSQRLLNKELQFLGDKYVIEWTLEQMRDCELFDIRIMSTDWKQLINLMDWKYPSILFPLRPKELALNDTPAQVYITYTINQFRKEHGIKNENYIYCLLQSTSPLRTMGLIYRTYSKFIQGNYNSLFTVNKYTFFPDGQIYWFRDHKDIWKSPSYPYFCEPTVQLDYPHDLRIAEYFIRGEKID